MSKFRIDWSDPDTKKRFLIIGSIALAVVLVIVTLLIWPGGVISGGTRKYQCRIANCTNEVEVKVDMSGNPVDGVPTCHGQMVPRR